ncbi:MAG TPA: glucose-6-phosphate isomerase [Actinomycetes bacterium]
MSVSVQVGGGPSAQPSDLEGVAAALAAKDPTLWGAAAEPEAAQRLGWLDLPTSSEALLPRLRELRDRLRAAALDRVVLAGMGGSSLAPEVITRTAGADLTILDSTDPHQVAAALRERIERTVVVVSSKSGGTIETDSHRRAFEQAFRKAGLTDAEVARRIVVVTDPGSPLHDEATAAGYEVVLADPDVGGRYSALSAFGLTPSYLAGADVERILADARVLADQLGDDDNPGLVLGRALGDQAKAGRDKLLIADTGSGIVGMGHWVEQLVAESTGKEGVGILPVVVEGIDAPGFGGAGPDAHLVVLGPGRPGLDATSVTGSLGAQFLLWEYATAVAGRILGINPFDQPNVAESKENTQKILDEAGDGPLPEGEPALVDGVVEIHGDDATLAALGATGASDLVGVLRGLVAAVPERGYLAVMAYLDRVGDDAALGVRERLARAALPWQVTFGWAPRFLHSTGQFHKGGPQGGVFLQLTGAVTQDVDVPGRPFTFGRLEMAQALGDQRALAGRSRPVVRLHLTDRAEGVRQLLAAAAAATEGTA